MRILRPHQYVLLCGCPRSSERATPVEVNVRAKQLIGRGSRWASRDGAFQPPPDRDPPDWSDRHWRGRLQFHGGRKGPADPATSPSLLPVRKNIRSFLFLALASLLVHLSCLGRDIRTGPPDRRVWAFPDGARWDCLVSERAQRPGFAPRKKHLVVHVCCWRALAPELLRKYPHFVPPSVPEFQLGPLNEALPIETYEAERELSFAARRTPRTLQTALACGDASERELIDRPSRSCRLVVRSVDQGYRIRSIKSNVSAAPD